MKEVLALTILFFLAGSFSIYLGIQTNEAIKKGEIEPVFQNPSDYKNSLYIFFLILIGTSIVLFLIRVKFELIKVLENIAIFFLMSTTFSFFFPSFYPFLISLLLLLLSEIKQSYIFKNLILLLSIPSASAIIGASLSFQVTFILFAILSIYDIVSVFVTKHMVYLAEKLFSKPTAFISVFPSKKVRSIKFGEKARKVKVIGLGAGDYFLPSALAVSSLQFGVLFSILMIISFSFCIFLLFFYITKKQISRPLPALPFLFIVALIFFLSLIIKL